MKRYIAAVLLMFSYCYANAIEVSETTVISAPIEQVWQRIEPFCGIANWHPSVD